MQYMAAVMRMFDILEQNVTKVDKIEKPREPEPGMETAYLLCATTHNVERIIEDMTPTRTRSPLYDAAHVFFVDAVSDELVEKLTRSKAGPKLKQLVELFINMWRMYSTCYVSSNVLAYTQPQRPSHRRSC